MSGITAGEMALGQPGRTRLIAACTIGNALEF